jgi:hypothetical protein
LLDGAVRQGTALLGTLAEAAVKRQVESGGRDEKFFTAAEREQLTEQIAATLSVGELAGRSRIRLRQQQARSRNSAENFTEAPTSFAVFAEPFHAMAPLRALRYFLDLLPALEGSQALDPERFEARIAKRAFSLAVTTEKTLLGKVHGIIADAMATGKVSKGPALIEQTLDDAGVSPLHSQYSELVFRTGAMDAYNTGASEEIQDPDVADDFPAWQWHGIDDGRERETHLAKNDNYYPNNVTFIEVRDADGYDGYNDRCTSIPVYIDDWKALQAKGTTFSSFAERVAQPGAAAVYADLQAFCGGVGGKPGPCPTTSPKGSYAGFLPPTPTAAQKAMSALDKAKGAMAGAAASVGQAIWSRLDPMHQEALGIVHGAGKYVVHLLEKPLNAAYHGVQGAALALAKKRGLSDAQVGRVAKVLAVADGVGRWTGNVPGVHMAVHALEVLGGPATMAVSKLGYYVPVASLAYVGYSGGMLAGSAVIRAARGALKKVRGHAETFAAAGSAADVGLICDALQAHQWSDWYEALLYAALDETQGNVPHAVAMANAAPQEKPVESVDPAALTPTQDGIDEANLARVGQAFPPGSQMPPAIVQGGRILDGHHRAELAKRRGEKLPVIELPGGADDSAIYAELSRYCGGQGGTPGPCAHVVDAVQKHGGEYNLAPLDKVRAHLASKGIADRAGQDAAILEARKSGKVTGSGLEGRHGISPEHLAAAIPDTGSSSGGKIGYLSLRQHAETFASIPVPAVSQEKPWSCGAAAILAVTRHFGIN